MKTFSLTLLALVAYCPLATAQTIDSIPIKVPAGMKPVLKKDADGHWVLEVVAVDTASAPAADAKPAPAATTAGATKSRNAQAAFDKALEDGLATLDWDRPVPGSPAFVALGISPEHVTTPTSPTDLAIALFNGSDRQGKIQTGFAVDFSPYGLFNPDLSHEAYAGSRIKRMLFNSTISIGTTKAASDGDAQRVALGLSVRLWNSEEDAFNQAMAGSELRGLRRRFSIVHDDPRTHVDDTATEAENLRRDAEFEQSVVGLFTRVRAAQAMAWGRSSGSVAWAPTWLSASGKWNDLRYDGSTAWAAASWQLDGPTAEDIKALDSSGRLPRFWHLLAQAQYREGEMVKGQGADTKTYRQDSMLAAGRLRFGTTDLNGSVELGYLRVWNGPQGDGDAVRYGLSLERKVADSTWLVVSAGHDMGLSGDLKDESFAVGGLRFGFGQQPSPEEKDAVRKAGMKH